MVKIQLYKFFIISVILNHEIHLTLYLTIVLCVRVFLLFCFVFVLFFACHHLFVVFIAILYREVFW